jgi:hypothetical protein
MPEWVIKRFVHVLTDRVGPIEQRHAQIGGVEHGAAVNTEARPSPSRLSIKSP